MKSEWFWFIPTSMQTWFLVAPQSVSWCCTYPSYSHALYNHENYSHDLGGSAMLYTKIISGGSPICLMMFYLQPWLRRPSHPLYKHENYSHDSGEPATLYKDAPTHPTTRSQAKDYLDTGCIERVKTTYYILENSYT